MQGIGTAPVELPCRQDANHGVGFAVENEIAADDAGVAAELRSPDSLAQHQHVVLPGCVLAACERAPERRPRPEDVEVRSAHRLRRSWCGSPRPVSVAVLPVVAAIAVNEVLCLCQS